MKHRLLIALSVLVVGLVTAAFNIGKASAATGCFNDTNGHWAETFICWMKDNGVSAGTGGGNYSPNNNVTRAEMAVFLSRQAEIPPSTGDVYMTFGPNEWRPLTIYDGTIAYFGQWSRFSAPTAGTKVFHATPALPSGLYGTVMYIKGVQICYNATSGGYLNAVTIDHLITHDDFSIEYHNTFTDDTDRTDAACRQYFFPTPSSFSGNSHLVIWLSYYRDVSGGSLFISSTTVILEPSAFRGDHLTMPEPVGSVPSESINPEFDVHP